MTTFKTAFQTILLAAAACLACLPSTGAAADHAVVLQYHHISAETPRSTSLTLEEFTAHLDYLDANGFSILPLAAILDSLRSDGALPDKCVAITVDDAYRNLLDGTFDLMKDRGVPCTVFVPTGAADDGYGDYLTWDDMRMMQPHGFSFASHGHDHLHMTERLPGESPEDWRARITRDITRSQERLEAELGVAPKIFAYPYGEFCLDLMEIVEDLGLAAFGQQSGPIWSGGDFRALPRFPASGVYGNLDTLRDKLLSLPMPVIDAHPRDPLALSSRPALTIRLRPGAYRLGTLSAFVSGQGRVPVEWVDRDSLIFRVTAASPLPDGRSRYNITLQSDRRGRFMWYSHPWLHPSATPGDATR